MFRSRGMMTPEERRSKRISYQSPIGGVLLGDQRVLSMVSSNLSRGGMFVDLEEIPAIGAELVCNLATAGGLSAIQVRGRVSWQNGDTGVGIEFIDLSDEQEAELDGVLGEAHEIPSGEQSAAVYELLELECADTSKTIIDRALQVALDERIGEGMEELETLPSLDQAIELPMVAPVPRYDPIDEPAFTQGDDAVCIEIVVDDTDQIQIPNREPRSWLLAAAVGMVAALAVGMAVFGLFQSDDSSDTKAVRAAEEVRDGMRHRVLALVEGETVASSERDETVARIRAAALADPEETTAVHSLAVGGAEVAPSPPKPRAAKSQVKRQVLGGVVIRETSESLLVRIPIEGSVEQESHYVMKDPAAFAVNLPNAQPVKGYSQSLKPDSDAVRLVWVRERLGGLHLRLFFRGERPNCEVQTSVKELVVRCKD
ncbi:MAG: PilZ domain-containing protein [Myxococcales bacterium]|nr:PilZ domain-containing protein [Myxococcales bacterium]